MSAFWHPQACEGEGGAEGLVGKAEEDPPGVRDHLLDGHVLGGQDGVFMFMMTLGFSPKFVHLNFVEGFPL